MRQRFGVFCEEVRAVLPLLWHLSHRECPYVHLGTVQYEILECHRDNGSNPIEEWLATLDPKTRGRVRIRIDRIEEGNFGDVEPIGEGLSELRLDFGPGYRVYFGQRANVVHLISGGFKSSQQRDINAAKEFWRTHE